MSPADHHNGLTTGNSTKGGWQTTQQSREMFIKSRQPAQRPEATKPQRSGWCSGGRSGPAEGLERWMLIHTTCRRLRISASRLMPSGMSSSGAMAKEIRTKGQGRPAGCGPLQWLILPAGRRVCIDRSELLCGLQQMPGCLQEVCCRYLIACWWGGALIGTAEWYS